MSDIARKLSKQLTAVPTLLEKYIELAIESIRLTKSNEAKLHLLSFLEVILAQRPVQAYQPILSELIALSDNSFYKISVASFKVVYSVLMSSQ